MRCSYLAVIKGTADRQVVHILIGDSCHLKLLNRTDPASRKHDENRHVLLAAQAVDGSRAGVATGSTNDCQMVAVFADVSTDFNNIED